MKTLFALVACLVAGGAYADVQSTPIGGAVELREADSRVISRAPHHPDMAACVRAGEALMIERGLSTFDFKCLQVTRVTSVGTCDPLPDDFIPVLTGEQCPGDETRWLFRETRRVQGPFPACAVTIENQVVIDCTVKETWWTPDPNGYVPALDPGALDGQTP